MVVGRGHDLGPQIARAHLFEYPEAVALALVGAGGFLFDAGFGAVRQFHVGIGFHRLHEGVGDADGDIEVLQIAPVLGVDEQFDIRVVAAHHAHLRTPPRAGGFDGFAGAVEYAHVRHRTAGARLRAFDQRALGSDGGEVIADAAAAPHGFGGFFQRDVDARLAVRLAGNRVAHRLHETVDQGGLQCGAGGGVDASGRDEAGFHGREVEPFPVRAVAFPFRRSQGASDADANINDVFFVPLGVFFQQNLAGNGLIGKFREQGFLHGHLLIVTRCMVEVAF